VFTVIIGIVSALEQSCFTAIRGAGATISKSVRTADVVAYEELAVEALRRLEVETSPSQ